MSLRLFLSIGACLQVISGLLVTTQNRMSSRNITCQNGSSSTSLLFNCDACLVVTRNYEIRTALSLTGAGPSGVTYMCLNADQLEVYHENLVRECNSFPAGTLNGYADFCVASPYTQVRGSYRACICVTNACNFNYSECVQRTAPFWNQPSPSFTNTIVPLSDRVRCYRPYEDYRQQMYSNLIPLCESHDIECKNFLFDNGVLCTISIDRANQITRQTLSPSIYSAHVIKFKLSLCKSFTWTSKSIYFSQCQQDETICFCAVDSCDKDLETCRTSQATSTFILSSFIYIIFFLSKILSI